MRRPTGLLLCRNRSGAHSATPHFDVTLVPVGTNFLKQGETILDHIVLSGATIRTIENAVLETDPSLGRFDFARWLT